LKVCDVPGVSIFCFLDESLSAILSKSPEKSKNANSSPQWKRSTKNLSRLYKKLNRLGAFEQWNNRCLVTWNFNWKKYFNAFWLQYCLIIIICWCWFNWGIWVKNQWGFFFGCETIGLSSMNWWILRWSMIEFSMVLILNDLKKIIIAFIWLKNNYLQDPIPSNSNKKKLVTIWVALIPHA
jgi:hypothetical protein